MGRGFRSGPIFCEAHAVYGFPFASDRVRAPDGIDTGRNVGRDVLEGVTEFVQTLYPLTPVFYSWSEPKK